MGSTLSTPRIEFETKSWPLDDRPYMVVERRGHTLYYGAYSTTQAGVAKYVDKIEPSSRRVGVERGEAAWLGKIVELVNPNSGCLRQERLKNPEFFAYNPPSANGLRSPAMPRAAGQPDPRIGKSLSLLSSDERIAQYDARNERTRLFNANQAWKA